MNTLSFITANYVARELNYQMTEGWDQGDAATQAAFRPAEQFESKLGVMLGDIKALGFQTLDLWGAHLHGRWATAEHLRIAKELLAKHELQVVSLAAWIDSLETLKGTATIAAALGATSIGGGAPSLHTFRADAEAVLKEHGVTLGIENHPEKTPDEVLKQIGDGADGFIGTALDTGWWATQGFSAPQAIRELKDHLVHVHLKDIKAEGEHETCRLGTGTVPITECLEVLQEVGYMGALGIEHEPETFDPTQDIEASAALVRDWLVEHG